MITVLINGVICPVVTDGDGNQDSILVTRSIADIEQPDEKQADHSKGFLIENTAAVQTLFSEIFEVNMDIQNTTEVNFTPDFNPNLKASIVVLNDNAVTLRGYCQMIDIIISDNNKINYNINAYASIGNFFNDIKNLTLNDLDFSDLNHDWTYDNVTDSWTPVIGTGYVYPMIDYGLTTNYNVWSVTSFRPALFVKEIIDRIFAAAGWAYSSAFFLTDRFKRLVIPFSAENLFITNDEIYDRSFLVGRDTSALTQTLKTFYDILSADPVIFNDDTGPLGGYSLHNTAGGDYDTATGIWTCAEAGTYQFGITLSVQQVNNTGTAGVYGSAQIMLIKNSTSIQDRRLIEFTYTPPGASGSTSSATSVNYTSQVIDCQVGDELYWGFTSGKIHAGTSTRQIRSNGSNIDIVMATGSAFSLIPQSNVIYGGSLDMNTLLPKDHLQKDFIMGLSKMFNLYFEQTGEKTLLIEPREDYFTSDTEDWTELMDIGNENPPKLIPMGMNQQKRYKFTYSEDKDWMNERYLRSFQQVYGTHLEDVTNDFLTETKEIKPIFAATPLSNALSGTNDRIISDMRFSDDDGITVKQGQTKLRILYWGGLISCSQYTMKNTPTGADVAYWTSYPYAGHLDNPYTPQFDLSFGVPEALYYDNNIGVAGDVTYTDANLFTQYWRRTIKEFTNKNSKVLEAMFDISLYRYMTLSFRKQYFIKEAYYRLIEMEDYNLNGLELVKCKLLKIDREAAYVTSSKPVRGGTAVFDSGGQVPTKGLPIVKDGRVQRVDKIYEGDGGYNTGLNTVNKGSGNVIPTDKTFVFGSDNMTILSEKVFAFNSDGQTILREGAMINGVDMERKEQFSFDETFVQEIDASTPADLLGILDDNEHYEVTKLYLSITGGTTNYSATGAGDIKIKTASGTVVGTIVGADWLGEGAGVIAVGTTANNTDFGDNLTIEIDGGYTAGDRDLRLVVFYKIIII